MNSKEANVKIFENLFEYLQHNDLNTHILDIKKVYSKQKTVMLRALEQFLPDNISYTNPEGGMFLWLMLPEYIDATLLFEKAIAKGIAFVPGVPFFVQNPKKNTLRLSFTHVSSEEITRGVQKLGEAFEEVH